MSKTQSLNADDIVEIADDNPIEHAQPHEEFEYTPIDHFSHFSGIGVSLLYLVAAGATLWEVVARYVFNSPTQWAFEVVMVLCAASWMLSAGYITLKKRHIGITVIHNIVSPKAQWRLDLFASSIGIVALFLLLSDASMRAYMAIDHIERTGSAFNSPMPMLLKTLLMLGGFMYLAQLTVNLWRHVNSRWAKAAVKLIGLFMVLYFINGVLAYISGPGSIFDGVSGYFSAVGQSLDPSAALDMRSYSLGVISLIMVAMLVSLMMTGMPLGIVTLIVSVVMAVAFFGPRGLYLVSANTAALLDHYTLIAIPFFVLMATILEKSGIAEDCSMPCRYLQAIYAVAWQYKP